MTRYLMHLALGGEPMGVHAEDGSSLYVPAFQGQEGRARRVLGYRGTAVPWNMFVEQKAGSVNHRSWWASLEDERNNLEEILYAARARWIDG